ncbi:hypothetical protein ACFQMH_16650 [Streptomyces viridiviolaceus]|uniref:Uncharacterized protein n=1 Tax=Streptomyces viridiviolaceus TaxID=68282 RepID=A0ABW2E010_9ACTN|nr:hypothetical protein [Streptomyces viridiviolaceus]
MISAFRKSVRDAARCPTGSAQFPAELEITRHLSPLDPLPVREAVGMIAELLGDPLIG